ncbi:MAG: PhzF family phenazine biosynthesis protein [Saprospiraceae bacterium]|nr:PhzF family phenazine biosynthesis protein [Saprospiraceae bacterium]
MKIPIYQVDAFTDKLFGGNPAAVCPLYDWLDDELLQNIAAENNLSETAFIVSKDNDYELRWFTPEIEIDLCGHATLAAAHVIFNYLDYKKDTIKFLTKSQSLTVSREASILSLDFPATEAIEVEPPFDLLKGLSVIPTKVYKSRDFMVIYESEDEINSIKPNYRLLRTLDCLGIIITAPGKDVDFVSRFFAPKAGLNEDPVSGSAHTTLIPYWAKRLKRNNLSASVLSNRRGELYCEYHDSRVYIKGKAVTFLKGEIEI